MKESTKLKPCPFCGHDVIESKIIPDRYMPAIIYCNLCGATLASISTEAAIEHWNTRHPDEDGVLKAMPVSERIRHAIDLDFCECGANRKLRIFISAENKVSIQSVIEKAILNAVLDLVKGGAK